MSPWSPGADWKSARPGATARDGRWTPQLSAPSGALLWQGVSVATEADAVAYAAARRKNFIGAAIARKKVETVELPPDSVEPAGEAAGGLNAAIGRLEGGQDPGWSHLAQHAQADSWEHLEPGVRQDPPGSPGGHYTGTLHERRSPFTERWACPHRHDKFEFAERCAVDSRRKLAAGKLAPAASAAPEKTALEVTRGTVEVRAPLGARVSVRHVPDGTVITVTVEE